MSHQEFTLLVFVLVAVRSSEILLVALGVALALIAGAVPGVDLDGRQGLEEVGQAVPLREELGLDLHVHVGVARGCLTELQVGDLLLLFLTGKIELG